MLRLSEPYMNGKHVGRQAREGEASCVIALLQQSFGEYEGVLDPPSGVLSETDGSVARQIALGQVLVCDVDGNLVGCAFCREEDGHLYVGRFGVIPACRSTGVGAMLLAAAEQQARELGYDRTRLNVRLVLDALRTYYERHGYAVIDYLAHVGYSGPTYVQMEKIVTNGPSN